MAQKYAIVKFLEPVPDDTEFDAKHWPLHVTLASNFVIDRKAVSLFEKIADLMANEMPVTTTASDDAYFGPQRQVHVTTLTMMPELQALTIKHHHYAEKGWRNIR